MRKTIVSVILLVSILLWVTLLGVSLPAVSAQEGSYHKVKWGETLSGIAWMHGMTVRELMDANDLANANVIYAGQELLIPGPVEEYVEHKVVSGDTLLTIAAKYGVSIWEIARRNGMWNVNLIFPGKVLIIPGGEGEAPPVEAPPAEEGPPVVQEAIIIATPKMNDDIVSPVVVTGWGSGFENTLAVDVLDEVGSVIGQGYAMVDAEFGETGPYTGTVEFTAPIASGPGRVAVYSISPRDGAIEHLSSVTVNLKP
jgi:LysM repeat protein